MEGVTQSAFGGYCVFSIRNSKSADFIALDIDGLFIKYNLIMAVLRTDIYARRYI